MSSSSPIQLNYLVFDDENEEKNQNHLNVIISGFHFNLIFINPNEFYHVQDDIFDIDDFKQKIVDETKGLQINLVATDWNMLAKTANYNEVNGLEIIEILIHINEKYKKCPFLIYSGNPSEASKVLVSKIKAEVLQEGNNEPKNEPISSLQLLSLLLELRIKFCARSSRFDEIKTLIKGQKTISLIVLNSLANFDGNSIINTGNEYYDGKKIKDLLDLISKDNDLGLKFIREFIELSIANYTELNVE